MLTIDGSEGEGGGQILRTALALSMLTATPFRMHRIRARRAKPGLMRQHVTSVEAAATICDAEVSGAAVGSAELVFRPGRLRAAPYHFAIGTAGSTTLVFQTVLFGLLHSGGPCELILEGGTHNPHSPPFDFLSRTFLPLLARMGAEVEARLLRPGFYPAGGGRLEFRTRPVERLRPLSLLEPAVVRARRAVAMVSHLPIDIARRELRVLGERLDLAADEQRTLQLRDAQGPGNVVTVDLESEQLTEVFTGFGERGVPAETVAGAVADEVESYLRAGGPVGTCLADQLLLPFALAGGGAMRTLPLSLHAETQIGTIRRFLDIPIEVERGDPVTVVRVGRP